MSAKKNEVSIGKMVRRVRKLAGLTQAELADLAGVGKTLVFNLENGHEKIGFDNLKQILRVLNIQIKFISPVSLGDLPEVETIE